MSRQSSGRAGRNQNQEERPVSSRHRKLQIMSPTLEGLGMIIGVQCSIGFVLRGSICSTHRFYTNIWLYQLGRSHTPILVLILGVCVRLGCGDCAWFSNDMGPHSLQRAQTAKNAVASLAFSCCLLPLARAVSIHPNLLHPNFSSTGGREGAEAVQTEPSNPLVQAKLQAGETKPKVATVLQDPRGAPPTT